MIVLKKRFNLIAKEQFVLTYALIKWFVLAVVAGVAVGYMTSFFILNLEFAIDYVAGLPENFTFFLLPLGIIISTLSIAYLAPDARGHGTEKVIEAIHERDGWIDIKVIPVKLFTTIVTIAMGGSAGKEGPAAQIGAGLTSFLAQYLGFNHIDRKKLVVCGISAGFSAVFGTPVAGAIFGLEVLYIGQIYYDVMLPSFISGVVSYHVAHHMGLTHMSLQLSCLPGVFDTASYLVYILAGVFFGLVALMHTEILFLAEKLFKGLKMNYVFKALLGSGLLLIMLLVLGRRYLGLGTDIIDAALRGESGPPLDFLWKSLFTSVTLSCGGSGGIVTPIFFIGATSGITFATLFGQNPMLFGPLGFVAVLAACANTPIAATIMAIELFGSKVAAIAAITCITAFFVSGHGSVYPSQILARPSSPILRVEEQLPVERASINPVLHELKVVSLFHRLILFIKERRSGKDS